MIYDSIPLTEYTGIMDSRFHRNISQEIADPAYRQIIYTLDNRMGVADGSDPRVLCMVCINKSTGDAKIRGVLIVQQDPCADILAVSCLMLALGVEFPGYQIGAMVIRYDVDGSETGSSLKEYMAVRSQEIGVKIDALKNSMVEGV